MKLYYPLKSVNVGYPPIITQYFGANPDYYARFLDSNGNPEKGHMGVDFQANHGTPVYASHDGWAFYVSDSHGGDGVYIRTQYPEIDGTYFTTIYWHLISIDDPILKPTVARVGRLVKAGETIGYADNSGAPFESSGDHLHFGLVPCDKNGLFLAPGNGYGGCIDPIPYFVLSTPPVDDTLPSAILEELGNKMTDPIQAKLVLLVAKILKAFNS